MLTLWQGWPIARDCPGLDETERGEINAQFGCFMLGGANNDKFSPLKDHLENQYTMGVDQYPTNGESLLGMINNFRIGAVGAAVGRCRQRDGDDDGLAFVQEGGEEADGAEDEDGVNVAQRGAAARRPVQKANIHAAHYPHKSKKCYHCGKDGYIVSDCPGLDEDERGETNAQFGYSLLHKQNTVSTN